MSHNPEDSRFESGSYSSRKVDKLKQMLQNDQCKDLNNNANYNTEEAFIESSIELETTLQEARKEIESLKMKLETLEKDAHDAHLRHLADLENTRRRLQKEKEDLVRYGNESLIEEILGTVDNLERILSYLPPTPENQNMRDGIAMVIKQFMTTLQQFGVTEIEATGQPFDPHFHEAIGQAASDLPLNTVLEVHQKGYRYHDRLLRPARVTVSS